MYLQLWSIIESTYSNFFYKALKDNVLTSKHKMELHKMLVFPLPAININESPTASNIEIIDAILKRLKLNTLGPHFANEIKLVAGDQFLLAHLHLVSVCCIGNETGTTVL